MRVMRLNKSIRENIIKNWKSVKWGKRLEKAVNDFIEVHANELNKRNSYGIKVLKDNPELHRRGFLRATSRSSFDFTEVCDLKRNTLLYSTLHLNRAFTVEQYAESHDSHHIIMMIESELKKYYEIEDLFKSQLDDVISIVYSCTTVEKLVELAPKFEKYIPKETTSRSSLPVPMDTLKRVEGML